MRLLLWGHTPPLVPVLTMWLLWLNWAPSCAHPQLLPGPHPRPFRLSLPSQTKSSPRVCPLKPEFQHPAAEHTRWLGSAARWPGPSVLVSFCPACCKLAAALSSEPPYLSRWTSQLVKGVPRVREHFVFHSSLPGVQVPS